ncbi:MAG: zf-HC2 domain-containing protein [Bryobacterales bacterium]|nr:zf-HC2 domain-containing protein [Bryobacterales bacterium]
MNCSEFDLKAYLLGEAGRAERSGVEDHLKGCPACREELERLRLTAAALAAVPEEEIPYRIAFVSDKIFEPKGWNWLWNSAPRLGFVSAAVLAAALLVHALARPATPPADMTAMEERIRQQVVSRIEADLVPVIEDLQYLQKRAAVYYRESLYQGSRQ